MSQEQKKAWLTVALSPGIGPATFFKMLKQYGCMQYFLEKQSMNSKHSENIHSQITQKRVTEALLWENFSEDNHIILWNDPEYPNLLKHICRPPPVLFGKGNHTILKKEMVAIVGGRQASQQGLDTARQFSKKLADYGLCIVSGLAHGIDAAAHEGACESNHLSTTIAVMGTGIDRIYPSAHRNLAHKIVTSGGLLLSEFPLGSKPIKEHFPQRNRIIAGLSKACLVVEAGLKSGSLGTAYASLEANREVMAIPGSILSPYSKGCHELIKQGALLIEQPEEILKALNIRHQSLPSEQQKVPLNLFLDEPILDVMGYDMIELDQLATLSKLPITELMPKLMELELEGKIVHLSGNTYQRIALASCD
jgi:DNA processing protein